MTETKGSTREEMALNVQEIMRQIQERARMAATAAALSSIAAGHLRATSALRRYAPHRKSAVGDPPPRPPTFRGWLGGLVVRFMRRGLFWYSAQINAEFRAIAAWQELVSSALREQGELLQSLCSALGELESQVRTLQPEIGRQRTAGTASAQERNE